MPVVSVKKKELFSGLGKNYTDDDFQDLCFQLGLELDDITSERKILEKERGKNDEAVKNASNDIIYKIEVPANRYDLLCREGLVKALRIYLGIEKPPTYKTNEPKITITVSKETEQIRPFVVCAVLRNITFDSESYKSFIDLQDKLHFNICRKRSLVAIGTHDLDTLSAPFTYEALKPQDISFVPLNKTKSFRSDKLLEYFETDDKEKHLKPYVRLIKNSPVYPVIYDSNRVLLSLPPIINSDHSKITLNTKNVFIEATAKDRTKAYVVLNQIVTLFSQYCSKPYEIEQVKVVYPHKNETDITPDLSIRKMTCSVDYVNRSVGTKMKGSEMVNLLSKMSLKGELSKENSDTINVEIPVTRSDILHECDIMEDIAIAYGFNNIPKTQPQLVTIGKPNPLNKISELLRVNMACFGFTEILTFSLCSIKEGYDYLNKNDDEKSVKLSKPKTLDFEMVRNSLIPGALKTLKENLTLGVPQQIFEISDVLRIDESSDVGAINRRNVVGLYCGKASSFEIIHGLLDKIMMVLSINSSDYYLKASEDPTYFPKRQAKIYFKKKEVGIIGVLHPGVLDAYGIKYPCSVLEMDLELLVEHIIN